VIASASEKMLKSNGHFLQAKMVSEQRAMEIARLQEALATHMQENNNMKIEIRTLKYVVYLFQSDQMYAQLMPYRETMALFANEYHEGTGPSTGCISSIIRAGNLPAKQLLRRRKDLWQILQWTRKHFRHAAAAQSNVQ
jgi:hypothetical protein